MIDAFLKSLETGSGFWSPLALGLAIVIALLLVYIIRGFGKTNYKKGTEQTKAFLSGNPEYSKDEMHVKGSNLYWGFTQALKSMYNALEKCIQVTLVIMYCGL